MEFATLDLARFEAATGADRAGEAARLDAICRDSGFLILRGHGVPEAVIGAVWTAAQRFFAQGVAAKQAVAAPYAGYPYGYLGPDKEALAKSKGEDTPPDLKESFNGGPLRVPDGVSDPDAHAFCYQPTLWPDLGGFRPAWEAYYAEMEALAARIMAAFAEALGLDRGYFAPFIGNPISALRALHYPATLGAALDRQQRAGAHTDYGSLTILLPQAGSRGLQVMSDGDWVDVPAEEGAFFINIGDLMARWTADRWVSTLHRVVALPDQPARQSLAFFHQPDWEAEITPLDGSDAYPAVRSGPYLMEKFRSAGS
ncbi:isopenicillin N synthase family oxygenase [Loktanella sp. IMCC34160]|uniref:isopenicillin N synthase family dioxygenase n=1 Tax=Loktanella sp. IMCC34160 TaxID=2510646 RepID=UPI00101B6BCC|nr:2OG-Fe(II) oxygenase family protein [Loktanella sp. IMCC34160]RYG89753.1 isopenicillin N synthase family oxygenase [Loktanella sp. IMCC34160]